jgi:hypothetical protein
MNDHFVAQDGLWIIELHNGEDSRLTARLIDDALRPALDMVEKHWKNNRLADPKSNAGEGALIIVGKRDQDKFFSNGFLYDSVKNNPAFFTGLYRRPRYHLTIQLLSYPRYCKSTLCTSVDFPQCVLYVPCVRADVHPHTVPTIAAINGHCFAGGFMLALCCDYRVMTDGSKRRAWLCMNEVPFAAVTICDSMHRSVNTTILTGSFRRTLAPLLYCHP